MQHLGSFSDDFYVNLHLTTEMELPGNRESILHHFEQIRRRHPAMKNFYSRERGEYVLEEDKDSGAYRWTSVDHKRLSVGMVNPKDLDEVQQLHGDVLELAPFSLGISPLDCETLNVMFGFDYSFRGNQNDVVAQAIGLPPAFERLREVTGGSILGQEPVFQIAIDEDCRTQVRVSIETRTTAYQIRTNEFPEEQLSAYLTVRRFGGLEDGETWIDATKKLFSVGEAGFLAT
ncbi:MAG: hypothetical protein R3B96_17280 [Pirellulaceae bacterium]